LLAEIDKMCGCNVLSEIDVFDSLGCSVNVLELRAMLGHVPP